MKKLLMMTLCLLFSACANQGGGFKNSNQKGSYQQAEKHFKQGRVMSARQQLLHIKSSHADYAKAQVFLKKTVEPARQRLLRYHRGKAVKAERAGQWFVAWQRYQQTAELSENKADIKKVSLLQQRLRGKRAKVLNRQLQYEDKQLQSWLQKYKPSRAFDANDHIFTLFRDQLKQDIQQRIKENIKQAKVFKQDYPELAYILLQSSKRLQSDAVDEKALQQLKARIPATIERAMRHARKRVAPPASKAFNLAHIQRLIEQQQWLKAQAFTDVLKRQGNKGKALLQTIQQEVKKMAQAWFNKGREAFSIEKVDEAVRFWHKAVNLMPSNKEYSDALQRALQVQERLHLIRGE